MTTRTAPNVIAGFSGPSDMPLDLLDVFNPASGAVIARVPMSGAGEVDLAVRAARAAFPAWAATPIKERVQVFYRYKALLERDIDELTALVTEENGKIASEARAEVLKSAELTEFACSLPQTRGRRSAGGEPGSRVPRRALSARRGRRDRPVQLPQHGAQLDASRTRSRSATA